MAHHERWSRLPERFHELIEELRSRYGDTRTPHTGAWSPSIDTELLLLALHHQVQRIDHIMKELDDLTAAVKSVTGGTDGIGAIIVQQRDTIAARDAKIKDLEALLAAGTPPPVITGIDPAALVPLTAELNADADKLVAAMMPPPPV